MFKWLSLNNFCISFLFFFYFGATNAYENIVNPSSLYKPIPFYYKLLLAALQTSAPSNVIMVTSNNPPSFFIQTCWPLKSRDFLAWNIIALSFSNISVCCLAKFMAFFNRHSLIDGWSSLISKVTNLYISFYFSFVKSSQLLRRCFFYWFSSNFWLIFLSILSNNNLLILSSSFLAGPEKTSYFDTFHTVIPNKRNP